MSTVTLMPNFLARYLNLSEIISASLKWLILTVGPTGISNTRWVVPEAIFLAMMETMILSKDSKDKGASTWMMMSSAGASPRCPPHRMQPPTFLTIFSIFSTGKVTGAKTSMVSAVPAGVGMAREGVLG